MGIVYRKQGQLKDALDSYKHAVRLNPDYAKAYYNMGIVYDEQGQLKDALDSYKHASDSILTTLKPTTIWVLSTRSTVS